MKKETVFVLKPMTKTSQVLNYIAVKSKVEVFRHVLSRKWPFKMAA